MARERNFGVDLLRLVLMFMVGMLHTLGHGGVLEVCEAGTLNYKIYWFLEVLSFYAVDGFALISGYMATDKPRKNEKIVQMWFQAFFYSFVLTAIFVIVGFKKSWDILDVIRCAFPMTFGKFWYFTAFFALFFAIPILNRYIFSIDEAAAKKTLIAMVVLFSCLGIIADPFRTTIGYSAIWLMVLYCIGALAKKVKLFEEKKSFTLVLLWACSILTTWGILVFVGIGRLINYLSPTMLLSAMIMVVLFSRLKLKGTVISKLSPLAFGIYLFQENQFVRDRFISGQFSFVTDKNPIMGILYVFAFALMIFVSGLVMEFVRSKIAKLLRIPALSKKIADRGDRCIVKLFPLLK